jgi:hypothetical protein
MEPSGSKGETGSITHALYFAFSTAARSSSTRSAWS